MKPRRFPRAVPFLLAVGAVLGIVPDWFLWYDLWLAIVLPVLLVLAVVSLVALLREFRRGDRARVPLRACHLAACLLAIPALLMLGRLSWFVDVARLGPALRAQAWAHDAPGVPHLAFVQVNDDFLGTNGYFYDDSGEAALPCTEQSAAWMRAAWDARFSPWCSVQVNRVIGPYYRWELQ